MAVTGGTGGISAGPLRPAPSPNTPLFNSMGAQIYAPYKPPAQQPQSIGYRPQAGSVSSSRTRPTELNPGPRQPIPGPEPVGPAPVVEPKPSAAPASLAGLDAAMSGGGSEGSNQMLGTMPNGLRMLGRRTPPMDSMALAAVAGSIY